MTGTLSHPKTSDRPLVASLMYGTVTVLPGLTLTIGIALAAMGVHWVSGLGALSPLMLAMVFGIVIRNTVGLPAGTVSGIKFALRRILRLAIVLLGFQLSLDQLAGIGFSGVGAVVATLITTFLAIKLMGRLLGVEESLTGLIAVGTSVCGASAVVAANAVIQGSDEDAAYAIACVTVFGSLSLLLFPYLGQWLDMEAARYGIWIGASVHEVAQVTGAAFQHGEEAGQLGTVAKLVRVALLAPLILTLGALASRRSPAGKRTAPPVPWFVLGFIAAVLLNTVLPLPDSARVEVVAGTTLMFTIALAAMGLETDLSKLRDKGFRPLILGAFGWVFISAFAWVLLSF